MKITEADLRHLERSEFDEVRLTDIAGTAGAKVWTRQSYLMPGGAPMPAPRQLFVIVDDPFDEGAADRIRRWLLPAA